MSRSKVPKPRGPPSFDQAWASQDPERRIHALLGVVLGGEDSGASLRGIQLGMADADRQVRELAVVCLGHWFRLHGAAHARLPDRAKAVLEAVERSDVPQGIIEDMRSDARIFAPHLPLKP